MVKMTFGKHKGKFINEIPWQYLKWAVKEVKFTRQQVRIKAEIQQELQRQNIFI